MKKEQLFEAINEIDNELLERTEKKTDRRNIWLKTLAIAACFAIVASFGISYALMPNLLKEPNLSEETTVGTITTDAPQVTSEIIQETTAPPVTTVVTEKPRPYDDSLPKLTLETDSSGGMGFQGYMAYDISELDAGNPWSEDWKIDKLPVYKNPWLFDSQFEIKAISLKEKENLLREIAGRLGLDTESLEIKNDGINNETINYYEKKYGGRDKIPKDYLYANTVWTEVNGIKIEVDRSLMAEIWFEPELPLPDGYKGIMSNNEYDEVIKTAEYIRNEYKELMGMKNPQISLFGDYGVGQDDKAYRSFSLNFFEGADDKTEQIINYNFNTISFAVGDEGIWIIRFWNSNLSDKVGDYPIISADNARALLQNGQYLTTVPEDFPGAEYVKKVELVYQNTARYSYFMPYYEFYVELPSMERANGLKTYGIYYVPAVEEQYITNMPKCIYFN